VPFIRLVRDETTVAPPLHGVFTEPAAAAGWTRIITHRDGDVVALGSCRTEDVTPELLRGLAVYFLHDATAVEPVPARERLA
jgi:hypothetical protein